MLICIIGKSSTGKSTVFSELLKNKQELIPVVPYTTRPMRPNEASGIEYHFVSENEMKRMENLGRIIETRKYSTVSGEWYYFTATFSTKQNADYILITTPSAIKSLSNWIGSQNIIVFNLVLDDKVRLMRSINREEENIYPNYSEVCRRFLADEEDFKELGSLNKLIKMFEINTNKCVNEIVNDIAKILLIQKNIK